MKVVALVGLLVTVLVAFIGSWMPVEQPEYQHQWRSDKKILAMSFTHADHTADQCAVCHHNYIDDTGNAECMLCHVTDERVAHLLREQFHDFCMGCHIERHQQGELSGPVRRCINCHVFDALP